jgi:hypothetical protein
MKPLHRMILLSSTYQQDYISQAPAAAVEADPEDRLRGASPAAASVPRNCAMPCSL